MSKDFYPNYAFGDTWQAAHQQSPKCSPKSIATLRAPSHLFEQLVSVGFGHINPREFELFVANVFGCFGYSTELTPHSGDDGVDVLLKTPSGETAVVQCKRYSDGQYNTPAQVREFLGTMMLFKAMHGYFVTLCSVSQQAAAYFEADHRIHLVDAAGFNRLVMMGETILLNLAAFEVQRKDPHIFICETLNPKEAPCA